MKIHSFRLRVDKVHLENYIRDIVNVFGEYEFDENDGIFNFRKENGDDISFVVWVKDDIVWVTDDGFYYVGSIILDIKIRVEYDKFDLGYPDYDCVTRAFYDAPVRRGKRGRKNK
jgi:hypothetical protein